MDYPMYAFIGVAVLGIIGHCVLEHRKRREFREGIGTLNRLRREAQKLTRDAQDLDLKMRCDFHDSFNQGDKGART